MLCRCGCIPPKAASESFLRTFLHDLSSSTFWRPRMALSSLTGPFKQRRHLLEAFMAEAGILKKFVISPATTDLATAETWLRDAGHGATDGVVAKELARAYEPGERAMIKVKHLRTADCVVGGFRYENGSGEVGSLLLGLYDAQGKLDHVGFTATITDEERPRLTTATIGASSHSS